MANPLDQYDNDPPALGGWSPVAAQSGRAAPAAQPSGPNPLDAFDNDPSVFGGPPMAVQPTQGEPNATLGSTALQGGFGLLRGLPDTAEGLANAAENFGYNDLGFHNSQTGESMFSQLGRDLGMTSGPAPAPQPYEPKSGALIKSGLNAIGLNPDNLPQPQNAPERIASTVGEVAANVLAPELAVSRLGLLGQGAKTALEPLLGTGTAGSMAANTAKGALAGLGSGVGQEVVPDKYKPAAGLIGGLAGGALGEAPGLLWAAGKKAATLAPPMTEAGVQLAAGRKLLGAAEDPDTAIATIGNTANPELVPGSQPTTGQLTGDKGLLDLERNFARENPLDFKARQEAQNAARLDALNNIQAKGDPSDVGAFFRSQLNDIDQSTQAALDSATANAQQTVDRLGGTQTPDVTGAQMRGLLDRSAPRMTGGEQAGDVTGQQMRGALEASIAKMEEREDALWKAIPKDVAVVSSPLKASIANVYGDMPNIMKTTLSAPEKNIVNEISSYPAQIPIQDLNALRTVVNNEMRTARSPMQPNDLAYGRHSQVRGAIDDAIEASVTNRAVAEQRAVAAGEMSPDETMLAKYQAVADEWLSQRSRQAAGAGSSNPATSGSFGVSGSSGTAGKARNGFPDTSGSEGVPGAAPLLDQAGADALKAATAATKEKKTLTQAQPIAGLLLRPYETSPYNVADASVPGRIWKRGLDGSATVTRYLDATKSSPEAVAALREAAAQSLRSEAAVNGFLSEQGFRAWRQKYAGPLQRLEQASPGFTQSLQASASNVGNDVRGILTKPGISDATVPSMLWKRGTTGAQSVRDFLSTTGNDQDAVAALKEAASNSLLADIAKSKTGGILDERTFTKWRTDHADALRELERSAPGAMAQYEDAASASRAVERAAEDQKLQREAYQQGVIGKLIKAENGEDSVRKVGAVLRGDYPVANIRRLVDEASKNPDAIEGLRRAVADNLQGLIGNTEVGTSGLTAIKADKFQSFVRQHNAALSEVLTPGQMNTLNAIGEDMRRSLRTERATKAGDGSDTYQNIAAGAKHGGKGSILTTLLGSGLGLLGGHGVLGGVMGNIVGAIRKAGYGQVDELVKDALLNPELARALMLKVPTDKAMAIGIANRIMRATAIGMVPTRPRSEQRN